MEGNATSTKSFSTSPAMDKFNSHVPLLASTAQEEMSCNDQSRPEEFCELAGSYLDDEHKDNLINGSKNFTDSSSFLDFEALCGSRLSASLVHIDKTTQSFGTETNSSVNKSAVEQSDVVSSQSSGGFRDVPATPVQNIDSRFFMAASDSQLTINDSNIPTPYVQKHGHMPSMPAWNELASDMPNATPTNSNTRMDRSQVTPPLTPSEPKEQSSTNSTHRPSGAESMAFAFDFNNGNFDSDIQLQQEMITPEEFLDMEASNIEKLLDQEEEIFNEENKFVIHSQQYVSPPRTEHGFHNASVMSTDTFASGVNSNMSIGEYMFARSEKVGELGGLRASDERPSFGMKLRSPSPRKPRPLLPNSSTPLEESSHPNETVENETLTDKSPISSKLVTVDKPPDNAEQNSVVQQSLPEYDTTMDASMMSSISEAISNMSVNMNNEQLAQALMDIATRKANQRKAAVIKQNESALSNQQQEVTKSKAGISPLKNPLPSRIPRSCNTTLSKKSVNATMNITNKSMQNVSDNESKTETTMMPNVPLGNKRPSSQKFVQEVKPLMHKEKHENTIPTHDDTQTVYERDDIVITQSVQEELPSLLNAIDMSCFPDEGSAREILSSTRTDFSMLKGSLSRESIEHLHKMLREKGYDNRDPISRSSSHSHKSASSSIKSDVFEDKLNMDFGEVKGLDCSDGTIMKDPRYSEDFQQLQARMSLANMETLVDTDFNEQDLKDDKKLEVIQEVSNEEVDNTQSTVGCDDTQRSADSQGTSADSIPSSMLKMTQQNVQSSTLLNPQMYAHGHMIYRQPNPLNMHSSLPAQFSATGVPYRPIPSPVDGQYHMPQRGPPTLLTGQSLMAGQMAQDYFASRGLHNPYYNTMYNPHQTAVPFNMPPYGQPSAPSTIGYSEDQSNLSTGTTGSGFNHSTHNQYKHMHPGYYPGSHSIDLGMHDYYYRAQRMPFSENPDNRTVLSVPNEITFQGIKCVSIVSVAHCSVTNNSDESVQVELNIISPTINCCFNTDGRERLSPHSSKSFEITFTPNKEGNFTAILEVTASIVGLDNKRVKVFTKKVNVAAQAVTAEATFIKHGGATSIEFKESLAGTQKSLSFKIANKTPAELPVCVFLCGMAGKDRVFTVSKTSLTDDNVAAKPMEMLCITLPPNLAETTLWVNCNVTADCCNPDEPPKEISATLYMQIDRQCMASNKDAVVLDTLSVNALACIAKLRAPKSMQPLTFTCPKNDTQVQHVPVRNCGNVRTNINFSLQSTSLFLLSPTHCVLNAGETTDLAVTFQPTHNSPAQVHNTLYMIIEENRAKFEVMIIAKSVPANLYNRSKVAHPEKSLGIPALFANKSFLNWGGVDVGKAMHQKVTLRTSKDGQASLPLRISIKGEDASSFQLITNQNNAEELSLNMELSLNPAQDKSIQILFSPTKCKLMNANLEIKTPLDNARFSKFTIPLSGYGGKSEVRFEGLQPMEANGSVKRFYIHTQKQDKTIDILIKNNGSRDAFIKAMFYRDPGCTELLSDGSVKSSPSQFILLKKTARSISITMRNVRSDLRAGAKDDDLVVCMCLWHGDEITRQLLKHSLKSFGPSCVNKYVTDNNPLRDISFDSIYYGEDDKSLQSHAATKPRLCDVQMFYDSLQQTHVQILTESNSTQTFKTLFKALDVCNKPLPSKNHRRSLDQKPVKEISKALSDGWEVSPDHVMLQISNELTADTTKVRLLNRSKTPLKFDTVWPGHVLTITPNGGTVDPESVFVLLLSANPSLASRRETLPWIGSIQLVAREGRGTKQLRVQIKEPSNIGFAPPPMLITSPATNETFATPLPSSGPRSNTSLLRTSSNKENHRGIGSRVLIKCTNITFPQAVVRNTSQSHLEFTNLCKSSIRWVLTSFAPAYVKSTDNSGDIYRSSYAAFVFSHTSGILELGTKLQIPVSFNPMTPGNYSQFWDLEFHEASDITAVSLDKIRLQLMAEATSSATNNVLMSTENKPKLKEDIYVSEAQVDFGEVAVGSSVTKKVRTNNRSKDSHNVKFLNVLSPFHLTHQKYTIRAKCYASLPIVFRPTSAGNFTGELVIQPDATNVIRVQLNGTGV